MRFTLYTLGCKSNQFESQAMAKLLTERGHQEVPQGQIADAFIINTCSVTAISDKKSRQTIRNVRKQNPNTLVAVCGCYAQLEPEQLKSLDVNLVGGTGNHLDFIEKLEALWQGQKPPPLPPDDPRKRLGIEALPSGGLEGRTRALLKIQDGCNHFCSYCIIPYARGRIRSLPLEEGRKALYDLSQQGYLEIVLTGIEISSWGKDLGENQKLIDFLAMAEEVAQDLSQTQNKELFFRLGSLEPRTITEEFCSLAKDFPSLRPHFHLSLQSGCDTVLKRMNRNYDTAGFFQSLSLLKEHFPQVAITTDLIVGFPQETQEEFAQTLGFLEKCQFSSMHIFPYSPRDGTPAAKMEGQIPKETKNKRAKEANALATEMTLHYNKAFLGQEIPVLFETEKETGLWIGHSPQHIQVQVNATEPLANQSRRVKILSQEGKGLAGQLTQ